MGFCCEAMSFVEGRAQQPVCGVRAGRRVLHLRVRPHDELGLLPAARGPRARGPPITSWAGGVAGASSAAWRTGYVDLGSVAAAGERSAQLGRPQSSARRADERDESHSALARLTVRIGTRRRPSPPSVRCAVRQRRRPMSVESLPIADDSRFDATGARSSVRRASDGVRGRARSLRRQSSRRSPGRSGLGDDLVGELTRLARRRLRPPARADLARRLGTLSARFGRRRWRCRPPRPPVLRRHDGGARGSTPVRRRVVDAAAQVLRRRRDGSCAARGRRPDRPGRGAARGSASLQAVARGPGAPQLKWHRAK